MSCAIKLCKLRKVAQMPTTCKFRIPTALQPALQKMQIDHFREQDMYSVLIPAAAEKIITAAYAPVIAKIQDEEFFKNSKDLSVKISDDLVKHIVAIKNVAVLKDIFLPDGTKHKNNNGLVMREIIILSLIELNYMSIDDNGKVSFDLKGSAPKKLPATLPKSEDTGTKPMNDKEP